MARIHIIHENELWLPPLRAALEAQDLPFTEWHLDQGSFDLDGEPPEGVFYNRMSASSHTRGHRYAPEYTASVLAWLKGAGRRVVNGPAALDLEISKVRQYAALKAFGVPTPATRVAVGPDHIIEAARALGGEVILKPNRGGKGLGVELHRSIESVEARVRAEDFDAGIDGTVLVQRYVQPAEKAIIRNEFVGGRLLYSVRVDTSNGFELCPAEACTIEDLACPVGEKVHAPFEILKDFTPPHLDAYRRFLAAHDIEVAGIEMITDAEGQVFTYDVNTNTNYNPDAEAAAGYTDTDNAGMWAVAKHLGEALRAG